MTEVFPAALLRLLADDRPVIEHRGRTIRGGEMLDLVGRCVAGLRAAGVERGRSATVRVGVDPAAFAALVALHAIGATVIGARPGLSLPADHVLDDVSPLLARPPAPVTADGRREDVARVILTSGSTGSPKGCAQTYAALTDAWALHPGGWPPAIQALAGRLDRFLLLGSLSSQVMWEYACVTLAAGGLLVSESPTARVITVGKLNQLARDHRAPDHRAPDRLAPGHSAPGHLPSDRPTSRGGLRAVMVSGSPLPPARLAAAIDTLGPILFHGYGQTETGMISMLTPDEMLADPSLLDTVGRPPASVVTDLRPPAAAGLSSPSAAPGFRGAEGAASGVGGVESAAPDFRGVEGAASGSRSAAPAPELRQGELYVRTAAQAFGYWKDPAETREVFSGGWVRTRDLASLDAGGYLRLLGRTRDVIIVQATIVYAGAVEQALCAHPAVAEAYVVGVPDDTTGEAIHAFVVPSSRKPQPGDLRDLIRSRLGDAAVPSVITLIDAVPLTGTGKPDKHALRTV